MIRESDLNQKHTNCWRRRTKLEKQLIVCKFFLIAVIIILIGLLIWLGTTQGKEKCVTPGCIETASTVLKNMDPDINPCDDFYQFACGNFPKSNPLNTVESLIATPTIVVDTVNQRLRTVLEKPIEPNDSKSSRIVKAFYQACMDTNNINQNSLPYLKRIYERLGGWPVIEGSRWAESRFDWRTMSYDLMRLGLSFNHFFTISITPDNNNSSRMIIKLDQPGVVTFSKSILNGPSDPVVQAYFKFMVDVVKVFGAETQRANHDMQRVLNFITNLIRAQIPQEERRDSNAENNLMTIRELSRQYPYVPWKEYINNILLNYKQLTYDDHIVMTVPEYFRRLENIIIGTPKDVLANYLFWEVTEGTIPFLNDEINDLQLEFTKTLLGTSEHSPRWKQCLTTVSELDMAVGALFVRNFFDKEGKKTMVELVSNIRHQFEKGLQSVEWMDDETRSHALEKAKAISVFIAYPDELLDDKIVDNFYKNLTLNKSNYLQAYQNYTLFSHSVEAVSLFEPFNKSDWRAHSFAAVTNAFYVPNINSIEFPAGILQGLYFDNNRPQYMNYGGIGYIIGHEITHGFDDQGQQFDKDGNLVNWWQEKTQNAFAEKTQCIIDQYSNFTVPEIGLNLNGVNNQGENVADNAAAKYAYLAYKKWQDDHGVESGLPGLNYTPEQLFWISVANIWCANQRNEYLRTLVLEETHAPSYYRVNVPLMNSKEFAKDFNCPVGSKMNPEKKCSVW